MGPELLEMRAAPGGMLGGMMLGAVWFGSDDEDDADRTMRSGSYDPLRGLGYAAYLSHQAFEASASAVRPELLLSQFSVGFTTRSPEGRGPGSPSPAQLEAADGIARDMIIHSVDTLSRGSIDRFDWIDELPIFEDLVTAIASQDMKVMRAGFVPWGVNPSSNGQSGFTSGSVAWDGSGATVGGATANDSGGITARPHGDIQPLRLSPPQYGNANVPGDSQIIDPQLVAMSGGSGGSGGSPPFPEDDFYAGLHDAPMTVPDNGVLWNDYLGFEPGVPTLATPPSHAASFSFLPGGGFTYIPVANWADNDSFSYTISNSVGTSDPATVTIDVLNAPPVVEQDIPDVDHWAQDTDPVFIHLWDHFEDPDHLDSELTFTATSTNDSIVSPSVYNSSGSLTLNFAGQAGDATIDVEARDSIGEVAFMSFQARAHDAETITVKEHYWVNTDQQWYATEDVLWAHNEHRWEVTVTPNSVPRVQAVTWIAAPWSERANGDPRDYANPFGPWDVFASAFGFQSAIGNPPMGDLAIRAIVRVNNTEYPSPEVHKAMLEASVEWEGIDPGDGETNHGSHGLTALLLPNAEGDLIFPERNHPQGATNAQGQPIDQKHDRINLQITISPAMPAGFSATLQTRILDPDDYESGGRDPNDVGGTNVPEDNVVGVFKNADPGTGLGASPTYGSYTFNAGDETGAVEVQITEPQAGNNWIAALHDERTVLSGLEFRADGTTLFRDIAGNSADVPWRNHTEILTAARTLWMEMDRMDEPGDSDGPFNADDPRFQPPLPPNDVLPDILLPALVFVETLPAAYDKKDLPDFRHYTGLQAARELGNSVRDEHSERFFWVIQTLACYEFLATKDNDPDSEGGSVLPTLGYALPEDGDGPNSVYFETIRDVVTERHYDDINDELSLRPIVVAHEALHRFLGWHDDNEPWTNEGIMNSEGAVRQPNDDLELTDVQFRMVQTTRYPR